MKRLFLLGLLLPAIALGQTTRILTTDSVQSGCVLNAANAACTLTLAGKSTAGFLITAISSPLLTTVFETSRDGTNWDSHLAIDMDNGSLVTSIIGAAHTVGLAKTIILGGGTRFVRVRCSAYTSGSATFVVTATDTIPIVHQVKIRPVDPQTLGSYALTSFSGTMAAALAANSPTYSFRWTSSTSVAVIRRVAISVVDITTAFAAGQQKHLLYRATSFSASDTGGTAATLTSPNGKLDTSFAATGVGDIRISSTATLTAGTRTLDAHPLGQIIVAGTTVANTVQVPTTDFWLTRQNPATYPLVLRTNEGIVIQSTVPATGTWNYYVTVEWDELPAFP